MTRDEAVQELIEVAEGMICHIDPYFIQKYHIDTDLARLKAELTPKLATLENALKTISEYGKAGICPYGCDTPEIAKKALLAYGASRE